MNDYSSGGISQLNENIQYLNQPINLFINHSLNESIDFPFIQEYSWAATAGAPEGDPPMILLWRLE